MGRVVKTNKYLLKKQSPAASYNVRFLYACTRFRNADSTPSAGLGVERSRFWGFGVGLGFGARVAVSSTLRAHSAGPCVFMCNSVVVPGGV